METNRTTHSECSTRGRRVAELEHEVARLREAEERHRRLFAAMNEGFVLHEVVVDDAGRPCDLRYVEMNDAFAALHGRTPADMVGHTIHGLQLPVSDWWIDTLTQVALTGVPAHFERYGHATERTYEVHAWRPRPGQCAVLFHDVSEQRCAQEALRDSEARFRELADATPHLVWTAEPDGRVDYYNRRHREFAGITPAGDAWKWAPALHPDDVGPTIQAWERAVATGVEYEIEHRVRRAGGSYRWYLSRAVPARDDEGRVTKWYGTATDIHAAKVAEEALRESEERFRSVLENSRDAIYRADLHTNRYDYLSPSVEALTGYAPQEIEGMPRAWVSERIHPEDRERYQSGIDDLQRRPPGERSEIIEYRWRHKDGRYRWISNSRAMVVDTDGRPVAVVGTLRDVTLRKEIERRLQVLNETLELRVAERTRQLRALAAELAVAEEHERRRLARYLHDDLQQTLAAVAFHLDRIHERALARGEQGELREPLDMLRGAIETSRSLTAELSPIILYDTGLEAALLWLGRRTEEQHGLRVVVEAAQSVDAASIPDDVALLLYQSVRELLFNVVKHAHAGEARIALGRPDPNRVEVNVADDGVGFDVQVCMSRYPGPSGFGLFSIRERLEYIGGSVRIESAPGHGTRVTLAAPLLAPYGERIGAPATARLEQGDGAGGPIRILLADDHAIVRKGLQRLLEDQPDLIVVGEAGDGCAAVELARQLHPDVVLMDLAMPNMDGIEATRRIAAEMPGIRVIGLSMYDDEEKEYLMRQAGAEAYIPKGGPPGALFAAIRGDAGG